MTIAILNKLNKTKSALDGLRQRRGRRLSRGAAAGRVRLAYSCKVHAALRLAGRAHKSVTTPGRSHSFLASRLCGQVESMRPVVLATPVAAAMPPAAAPAPSASVRGLPKPTQPPITAARAVFTCTTSRCWQDQLNVLQSDTAPQQQALTRVADRATEHTIRFETWVGYNSTWKYFKERARAATCHAALLLHSCAHASSSRPSGPPTCGARPTPRRSWPRSAPAAVRASGLNSRCRRR